MKKIPGVKTTKALVIKLQIHKSFKGLYWGED